MNLRPIEPSDQHFLKLMLYEAVSWRGDGQVPPFEEIADHPYLAMYHEGWGRDGDAGYVAEVDGEPIGACWYRSFTDDHHGEGYVDEHTPELAISVVEGWRGRGVGRALMERVHEHARRAGVARMALSVNRDNPAKRLYVALGYVDVAPDDPQERMTLDL